MIDTLLSILRDNAWNGIAGLGVLITALFAVYRSLRKLPILPTFLRRLLHWIRLNPRYVASATITAIAALASFALTRNKWAPLILVAYGGLLAVLALLIRPRGTHRFHCVDIATIANAFLHDVYDQFPQGQLTANGVPFSIADSRYDTSQASTSRTATIRPQPPIPRPIEAHFLINAGGARSSSRGTVAGRITFIFADGASFSEDLVIGKNIREWAVGNASPGLLVVDVSPEAGTHIVWSGRNISGNDAIADALPIAFPVGYRRSRLSQIDITRDVGPGTSHKDLGFFLSAVTIEHL